MHDELVHYRHITVRAKTDGWLIRLEQMPIIGAVIKTCALILHVSSCKKVVLHNNHNILTVYVEEYGNPFS